MIVTPFTLVSQVRDAGATSLFVIYLENMSPCMIDEFVATSTQLDHPDTFYHVLSRGEEDKRLEKKVELVVHDI